MEHLDPADLKIPANLVRLGLALTCSEFQNVLFGLCGLLLCACLILGLPLASWACKLRNAESPPLLAEDAPCAQCRADESKVASLVEEDSEPSAHEDEQKVEVLEPERHVLRGKLHPFGTIFSQPDYAGDEVLISGVLHLELYRAFSNEHGDVQNQHFLDGSCVLLQGVAILYNEALQYILLKNDDSKALWISDFKTICSHASQIYNEEKSKVRDKFPDKFPNDKLASPACTQSTPGSIPAGKHQEIPEAEVKAAEQRETPTRPGTNHQFWSLIIIPPAAVELEEIVPDLVLEH
jgi:hypothetical protein